MPARAAGPGRRRRRARRRGGPAPPRRLCSRGDGRPFVPRPPGRSELAARRHAGLEAGAAASAFPPSFDIARVASPSRRAFPRRLHKTEVCSPDPHLRPNMAPGSARRRRGRSRAAVPACLTPAGRRGGRGEGGEGRAGSLAAGRGPRQRRGRRASRHLPGVGK